MYFIQPTRSIPHLDKALDELPSLQIIHIDDLELYDQTIIAIADVQDFLQYQWALPTIVIAFEDEGAALLKLGNLVLCRLDLEIAQNPVEALFKLMLNINVIKIVVIFLLRQNYKETPAQTLDLLNYKIETFFSLLRIYQVTGMITGKLMIKKYYFI
jgi:hypothetical protein